MTRFNYKRYGTSLLLMAPALFAFAQRPNVVYVFPDQMRNSAMGFWSQKGFREQVRFKGDPVHTPNIDRFARESVVLTSAMSNFPLSSPHRGMLLTGMYPNKSGIPLNCVSSRPLSSLRDDAECISDVMSEEGYDCAYIGKLHAHYPTPNDPEHPGQYVEAQRPVWDAYTPPAQRHGFNYWYSYGTFDEHKNPHYWDTDGHRHDPHEWSPLHEAKKAIDYIRNVDGVRDPKKPFFMMISMNPPHSPYRSLDDCMEEDYVRYANRPLDSLLVRPNADRTMKKAENVRYYFSSVTGVDRAFGQILSALKEAGIEENTIVVFSSDHGETMCSQGIEDPKNSPYTESVNIPFIVRYPGKLKPKVDNLLLSSPDIMPTLLGLAGLSEHIPASVQGKDYSSLLRASSKKKKGVERPKGALYIQNLDGDKDADGNVINYFPSARGIKTDRYTLAIFINKDFTVKKTLLFDDEKDPYQQHNLRLEDHQDIILPLLRQMSEQLKEIDDPWYREGILDRLVPDFSYAGYHHGETIPPAVETLGYQYYDVTSYGAIPNDGKSDRDALEATIEAIGRNKAEARAVIYFPEGTFILHDGNDDSNGQSKTLSIPMGHVVLKGAGKGKTILLMDAPNQPRNPNQMWSAPVMLSLRNNGEKNPPVLAAVKEDTPKGQFAVVVDDPSQLKVGQWVCLSMKNNSPEVIERELGRPVLSTMTSLSRDGVTVSDIHQIRQIEGNLIVFKEPLMRSVIVTEGWQLLPYRHYEEVGVEDLTFVGHSKDHFVHHGSWEDDSAYKPLDMTRLANSWIRRVGFESVSEACTIERCANVSATDIEISGNRGHSSVRAAASSRVFMGKIVDHSDGYYVEEKATYAEGAGQFHACGVSKQSMGTVIWRCTWGDDGCFEAHARQPRATLIDVCKGGFMQYRMGGALEQLPNHLNDLVLWNFCATRTTKQTQQPFQWWSEKDKWTKCLPPVVVGFHGVNVPMDENNMRVNLQLGMEVTPASLYERQLKNRLGKLPRWVVDLRDTTKK